MCSFLYGLNLRQPILHVLGLLRRLFKVVALLLQLLLYLGLVDNVVLGASHALNGGKGGPWAAILVHILFMHIEVFLEEAHKPLACAYWWPPSAPACAP